ncbi:hypothetical protein CNMCM8689_008768 [Aspergillus fumigatus]|nr:hypothetical protein CNMCM8689_008768 [Aspergillus fumigatus]
MSGPNLHNALLRPPIIQILRAAGFHATRPSVLDTLADLTARYMMILASSVASHAANAHPNDPAPAPVLEDVYQALQDVGALRPQLREWEEDWQGEEDTRGLENFLGWFTGPANREIRRVAGFLPSEGDMIDPESLEKEDFLTALKKKHSKTGEESRYAGTVLGKSAEEHPIIIEGGVPSIQEWSHQVRSRAPYVAGSDSSGVSSAPSNLSEADDDSWPRGDINSGSFRFLIPTIFNLRIAVKKSSTMVYAFALPTTTHLSFQTFLSSSTHPSLPQAASTARHALRLALKAHKRLPHSPQRDSHLITILDALNGYLPYLAAISHGLSGRPVESGSSTGGEEIEVTLHSELETEWRATLSSTPLSLKSRPINGRVRGQGIDFEIAFVLTTLGYVLSGLARSGILRALYAPTTPTPEQRTAAVQTATKYLLQASSVHSLLASSPSFIGAARQTSTAAAVPDLDPAAQAALSSLALAEATLLAVLKDDSYVAACIQARNPNDKDWMVRAPEIPKLRALLFARLCVRAAEYAEQAAAGMGTVGAHGKTGIDEEVVGYARVLGRVARARACRFFGVDAELAGKIGEGIAWLRAAKGALGLRSASQGEKEASGKSKGGLSRLKKEWAERREERRLEKESGGKDRVAKGELDPGDDAGREEECRVIEMLETKWERMNDTINTQIIPPSTDLLANLPSGRDIHSPPGPYKLPSLDEEQLVRMRAPPAEDDYEPRMNMDDSDDELTSPAGVAPGALPERSDSTYY